MLRGSDDEMASLMGSALGPVVARNIKRDEFTGKKDQVADFPTNGAAKPARVVVMGLGKGAQRGVAVLSPSRPHDGRRRSSPRRHR